MVPFKVAKLVQLMDEKELTARKLGKQAHCSEGLIRDAIKRGTMDVYALDKVACALDLHPCQLMPEEDFWERW